MEKKILTEEEEADEIVKRLATHPAPPESFSNRYFRTVILPLIRSVEPKTIAADILSVQPMWQEKDKDEDLHS